MKEFIRQKSFQGRIKEFFWRGGGVRIAEVSTELKIPNCQNKKEKAFDLSLVGFSQLLYFPTVEIEERKKTTKKHIGTSLNFSSGQFCTLTGIIARTSNGIWSGRVCH